MKQLTLALLLLSPFALHAATLCVSVSARGSGNGSDWNNTLAQSFTPVRGNTYYVEDGSYSGKSWGTANSGTTRITFKKATVADHGPSTGWADAMGDGEATFSGGFFITSSYWTIDGTTRNSDWRSGYGFRVINNTLNAGENFGGAVSDITFRYIHVDGSASDAVDEDNVAIVGNGKSRITVEYCYLSEPGNCCIQANYADNLLVQYCWLEKNEGDNGAHSEIIVLTGNNNATFRYNVVFEARSTAAIGTPTVGHFSNCVGAPTVSNWYIYGNVFKGPFTTGNGLLYLFDASMSGDFYFVGNTIVGVGNAFTGVDTASLGGGCAVSFVCRNNVYISASQGPSSGNVGSPTITHNAFWSDGGAATGSSQYTSSGNPLEDWTGNDFALTEAAATAMDAGVTVTVSGHSFGVDMFGNTRGADGKLDRGAIEFQTGEVIPDTNAPLVTSISSGTPLSAAATITASANEAVTNYLVYWITSNPFVTNNSASFSASISHSLSGLTSASTYNFYIVAGDSSGNSTNAGTNTFVTATVDSTAPVATLTAPADEAEVSGTIAVTATATDNVGVTNVQFFYGTTSLGNDTSSPYSVNWNTASVANGDYGLYAIAKDSSGNSGTSGTNTVTVNNAPGSYPQPNVLWEFDEGSGTTATDEFAGRIQVLAGGATWSTDDPFTQSGNTSLLLDGVNDQSSITNGSEYDINGAALTVAGWFKVTSKSTWQQLVLKGGTSTADAWHIYIGHEGATTCRPYFRVRNASDSPVYVDGPTVNYGTWFHLAGVYDGSAIHIYVNGVHQGGAAQTGNVLSTTEPLYVGRRGNTPNEFANTLADRVGVWSVALTDAEIDALYDEVPGVGGPSLPGAPTLDNVQINGANKPALNWTAGSTGGASITNYLVKIGTSPGTYTVTNETASLTYTYTDASDGTTYYFAVAAQNSKTAPNIGPDSVEKSGTTYDAPEPGSGFQVVLPGQSAAGKGALR